MLTTPGVSQAGPTWQYWADRTRRAGERHIPQAAHVGRETEALAPARQAEHPIAPLLGGCSPCGGLADALWLHPQVRSSEVGAGVSRVHPEPPTPASPPGSAADSRLRTSTAAGTAEREATKMI